MRTILAFALALVAVLFAFDNQNMVTIYLGPFEVTESIAIIVISTFIFGIITGIAATVPSRIMRNRAVKSA